MTGRTRSADNPAKTLATLDGTESELPMTMHIHSDSDFRDAFLEGAARAFFVLAYASFVEEGDSTDNDLSPEERATRADLPRPGPGGDWYDYAPPTPINAYVLAGEMWAALHAANGAAGVYSLAERAAAADGVAPDPEEFGRDLAMQYAGTGVSWFDDHAPFPLVVPHAEVSEFSFASESYQPITGPWQS